MINTVVCSKCGAVLDASEAVRCRKCGQRNAYVPPEKPKKKVKEYKFPYKKKEVFTPVVPKKKEIPILKEEEEYVGD